MRVDQNTAPQPSADAGIPPTEIGMEREEPLDGGTGATYSDGRRDDDIIPDFPEEEVESADDTPGAVTPEDGSEPPATPEVPQDTISRILEKYKGKPEELAKALYNAQAHLGRQGNELGNLRKQLGQQPQEQPQEQPQPGQAPAGYQPPQQPAQPQAPQGPALSFRLPTAQERAALASLPRDPETGLPTYNGQNYEVLDTLGIPVRDDQYWRARANVLRDQYPDATDLDVMFAIQNEQRQFDGWRQQQAQARVGELSRLQEYHAEQAAPQIQASLKQWFPENVIPGIVQEVRRVAAAVLQDARQRGASPEEVNDPEAMAKAMNLYYFTIFSNGQLVGLANRLAQTLPNGNNATPQTMRNGAQLPPGGTMSPPATAGAGTNGTGIRKGAKPLVDAGFLKSDEVDRYLSDNFDFDGI